MVCVYISCRYYLWRDQGMVEARSLLAAASPCYLNRHEAVELAFGVGKAIEQVIRNDKDMDGSYSMCSAQLVKRSIRRGVFICYVC